MLHLRRADQKAKGHLVNKSVSHKRLWISVGLAIAIWACALIVCGLGANWLWQTFIGDPPGQGDRAQLGYQACAPIIAALESYQQAHGAYPASLQDLVPTYLPALPGRVNGYPIRYSPAAGSYTLEFDYERPGMNRCVYSPGKHWTCQGYF